MSLQFNSLLKVSHDRIRSADVVQGSGTGIHQVSGRIQKEESSINSEYHYNWMYFTYACIMLNRCTESLVDNKGERVYNPIMHETDAFNVSGY